MPTKGSNAAPSSVRACAECNRKKGAKSPYVFAGQAEMELR
jgi:hypothetical protein